MRLVNYLLAVLSFVGLLVAGWWGVYQSPHSAANLEAALQARVDTALAAAGLDWASAEVDGQLARISGAAPSDAAAEKAERVVLQAYGPGGMLFGGVTKITDAMEAAAPISPYVWRAIKTETGQYVMTGHVPSDAIRAGLLEEASASAQDATVDDQMELGAGAPAGNWQGVARLGVRQLASLDTGEAKLTDSLLTVSGIAMDDPARARVSAEVANIAAPYRGEPNVRGASLWTATHEDDALVLAGKVASEAERDEIVSIAEAHFAGEVRDEMIIADQDYEGWMDGVRLGLPHFSDFQTGEMGFAPADEGFRFEGEAAGSTLAYLREDMATLEGPYGFAVEAEAVQVSVSEIAGIDFGADPAQACQAAFDAVLETNKVYFESGNAEITRESGETLDKLMAVSAQCDAALRFELGGHTDDQGDRAFNVSLSEARAAAVAAYMTAAGFDGARLAAIGYGPDIPVGDNATADGRAQNRRIEFKVLDRSN